MLSDLRRALYEAISESAEVHQSWRQLREEGYSLSLMVDCKREDREEGESSPVPSLPDGVESPRFEINGDDLSFLRSIGIDPTRDSRHR